MSEFWPIYGDMRNPNVNIDTAQVAGDARRSRQIVDDIELRLERAMMSCEAMWSILRERLGVTDVDLAQRINEIDLTDGALDGKVRRSAVSCPKCQRPIARRFNKCMYCGQMVVQDPFA